MYATSIRNQRGQSIIQVLISIGLMGILIAAFASMVANQTRETKALSDKLAALDLEKLLAASLSDGSVCNYIVNNPAVLTFDSTRVSSATPQIITPTEPIYASVRPGPPVVKGPVVAQVGQTASTYSSSAIIQSIRLSISGAPSPLPPAGPGATFTGNWLVTLDPASLVRSIAPVSVATTLIVDTTTPTAAKITGCQQSSGGGAGTLSQCGIIILLCDFGGWGEVCPAGYTRQGGQWKSSHDTISMTGARCGGMSDSWVGLCCK